MVRARSRATSKSPLRAAATLEYLQKTKGQYDAGGDRLYGDPALFAARELLDVPVIGIGRGVDAHGVYGCTSSRSSACCRG